MKSLQHAVLLSMCCGAALLPGCATGTTFIELSRTAGFAGSRPGRMYVVNVEGKDADAFRDQLYKALRDDGHFIPERYGMEPTGKTDSTSNVPSIVLSGIHTVYDNTRYSTEGSGENEKKYKERTETHEFQYVIRDAETGEDLDANIVLQENVSREEDKDASFIDQVVGGIVKGAVEDLFGVESAHRKELIGNFIAALRLHQESRLVGLFRDKEIPELEEGIEFVQRGKLDAAIAKFQAGAEKHPNNQALHKAYFNLGVAFEYNHEFEKALVSFRLAHELAPQELYAAEIDQCQRAARQFRWHMRYNGAPAGLPR